MCLHQCQGYLGLFHLLSQVHQEVRHYRYHTCKSKILDIYHLYLQHRLRQYLINMGLHFVPILLHHLLHLYHNPNALSYLLGQHLPRLEHHLHHYPSYHR